MSLEALEEVNSRAPTLEELDGWIPLRTIKGFVHAKKKIGEEIVIKPFKAEGKWKKVYDWLKERKKILDELEASLPEKYEFVPKEEAEAEEVEKAEDWCAEKGGVWRTIRGHRICLMPGESPKDAFNYRQFQIDNPKDKLVERAKKEFGVTKKIYDAGFIIEDGSMIDMEHNPHEAIGEVLEGNFLGGKTDYFMKQTNAMRVRTVKGREGYDNLMVEVWSVQDISPAQWESLDSQIKQLDKVYFYYDVMGPGGRVVKWGTEIKPKDSSKLKDTYLKVKRLKEKAETGDKITFKIPLIERWKQRGYKIKQEGGAWTPSYSEEEEEEDRVKKGVFQGHKGKWITLKNGQHVFVREGETLETATGRLRALGRPKQLSDNDVKGLPSNLQSLASKTKIEYSDIEHSRMIVSEKKPVLKIPVRYAKIKDKERREYRIRSVVYHELGHSLLRRERMPKSKVDSWLKIHRSEKIELVTLEDKVWDEDFAQSFMLYHLHRKDLKTDQPKRYEFINDLHEKGARKRKVVFGPKDAEKGDWCTQADGEWITHKGKHICIGIKDLSKVPKELRPRYSRLKEAKDLPKYGEIEEREVSKPDKDGLERNFKEWPYVYHTKNMDKKKVWYVGEKRNCKVRDHPFIAWFEWGSDKVKGGADEYLYICSDLQWCKKHAENKKRRKIVFGPRDED